MPDNAAYMMAAYVVAALVYLGYAARLFTSAARTLKDQDDR